MKLVKKTLEVLYILEHVIACKYLSDMMLLACSLNLFFHITVQRDLIVKIYCS
jgi:hypothetical protein